MRFGKELNQALKVLWVFAIVTSVFRIIQKFSLAVFLRTNRNVFMNFLEVHLLWLISISLIIAGIGVYIRRTEGEFNLNFIHNPMIHLI